MLTLYLETLLRAIAAQEAIVSVPTRPGSIEKAVLYFPHLAKYDFTKLLLSNVKELKIIVLYCTAHNIATSKLALIFPSRLKRDNKGPCCSPLS